MSSRNLSKALPAVLLLAIQAAFAPAHAGPADDASHAVEQWAAAFNAGDLEKTVAAYTGNATVHGTTSPDLAVGTAAVRAYFVPALRNRNQVKMGQAGHVDVLSPDHVLVAGFYEFSGNRPDGQAFAAPARYSFMLIRQDNTWLITHHHSSPRPKPAQ